MKNLGIRQLLLGLALCIASLGTIMPAQGQTGVLIADYPTSYVVQDGDTLWNIASHFLRDPQLWPDICQPDEYLDNPGLIYQAIR